MASNKEYNKFLSSKHNIMNIQPQDPENIYTYYVGVFYRIKNSGIEKKELIEVEQALSGSRLEDYFPMMVECLNKRGNWKCINTNDALNIHHIDLSWCNSSEISKKSSINYRFLLNSVDHYISNKKSLVEMILKIY